MLTSRISSATARVINDQAILSAIAAAGLLVGLIYAAMRGIPALSGPPQLPETTPFLGRALLTTYALPFEVVSILLLAGMVGAIVLARKE
jgi:NADH-quinone oxidoreductase subunit J